MNNAPSQTDTSELDALQETYPGSRMPGIRQRLGRLYARMSHLERRGEARARPGRSLFLDE